MEKHLLGTYIKNPEALDKSSLDNLYELTREFPYFQTAWTLLAKNLHNIDDHKVDKVIKIAATYSVDRNRLFNIISSKNKTNKKDISFATKAENQQDKTINKIEEKPLEQKIEKEKIDKKVSLENKKITPPVDLTPTPETLKPDTNISNVSENLEIPKDELQTVLQKRLEELKKKVTNSSLETTSENLVDDKSIPVEIFFPKKSVIEADIDEEEYIISDDDIFALRDKKIKKYSKKKIKTYEFPTHKSAEKKIIEDKKSGATNENQRLLDKFIDTSPEMKPSLKRDNSKTDFNIPDFIESGDFVTETLAKIYIAQGHYEKALLTYEKLSLKYPQKNVYFASRINGVKKLIQSKEN
jgi:hypothetical protein